MQYLHLTEDENGVSHFRDGNIAMRQGDFAPPAPVMLMSEPETCAQFLHLILPVGWGGARHCSPRRQVAYCLAGRLRVEAGDGDIREIGPGGIWRMEDTTGDGHTTTVLGDTPVQLVIVQLA